VAKQLKSVKKVKKSKIYSKQIPYAVGQELGSGAYGRVYQLKDNPNKVIKISRYLTDYGESDNNPHTVKNCRELFKTLKKLKPDNVARIYNYKVMKKGKKFRFYYVAEKLNHISNYDNYYDFENKYDGKEIIPNSKLYFIDCHDENVMECKSGKLKICDLDAIILDGKRKNQ
jgi:beta-galactosidase GanA